MDDGNGCFLYGSHRLWNGDFRVGGGNGDRIFYELGSIEDIAAVEVTKNLATTEQLGIKELTNNWPENVYYDANGVYADPLSTTIEITEPVTLTISGVTMDGSLRLKILNQDTYEVFLDEKNPEGEYTVSLNQSGMYTILFYAKEHVGSVDIVPEEI